jgi:hypothetical protein
MMRNLITLVAGIILSWVLSLGGSRLAWLLIVGNADRSENKDAIVRVILWQMFFVVPAICVVVGGFIASTVRRSAWWLGGMAVLPLLVYGVIRGAHGIEIVLSVVYAALAFAAASLVCRFKRPKPA